MRREVQQAIAAVLGIGKDKVRVVCQPLGGLRISARTRADAGAAKFDPHSRASRLGIVLFDMAHPVLMHIATQKNRVGNSMLLQRLRQAGASGLVTVPAIVPQGLPTADLAPERAKQGLLAQHLPAGLPAAGACQFALEPLLLSPPQDAAPGIQPSRASSRVDPARARGAVLGAGLGIFVLAGIKQVKIGELAKLNPAVNAHLGAAGQPGQGPGQHGLAHWHVLVPGLVGGGPANGKVDCRAGVAAISLLFTGIVVLHLMVVPGHPPRAGGMHGLQVRVTFVEGIASAVVVQRQHPAAAGHAHPAAAARVLVDVVAQKYHAVGMLGTQMAPGTKKAILPLLAGGVGQPQALHLVLRARQRQGAPDRADMVAHHEAVKVPTLGRQAGHLEVHRMGQLGWGQRLPAVRDAPKALVISQFPAYRDRG